MDYLVIDVRSSNEYATGHVDSAINVPLEKIADYKLDNKDQLIVVYCASGARSAMAKKILEAKGIKKVVNGVNAEQTRHLLKDGPENL